MNYVVAIDGSDEAAAALEYALEIAAGMDAGVTAVHAVDPRLVVEGGSEPITTLQDADDRLILESVADAEDRGSAILEETVDLAAEMGHQIDTQIVYGAPLQAISQYVEDADVNAVFVGHRGRSERASVMLGSVAKGLVERVSVPVTVVR